MNPFDGSETARFVAWGRELRAVHSRLRDALRATRESLDSAAPVQLATRDLLLLCHGFCVALTGHHRGEDATLFPAIASAHPGLRETLDRLQRDHAMIGQLIGSLEKAIDTAAKPAELVSHLEGIAAIMESHFRYEERQLLSILDALALDADPRDVLGPL
jgi:hemerythrin-like domain-containing protein